MSAPIIYLYDFDGWLIGQREAQEHPAAPGEYLTDVLGGTLLAPPQDVPAQHTPRLNAAGDTWDLEPDYFGRVGWLGGQPHTVATHGLPPHGWTAEEPETPAPTLAEMRTGAVATINAAFEAACAALLGDEPASATATYSVQQAEAEAFSRDSGAPTPMLDMLSYARGIAKADLVGKVMHKAGLYTYASGLLLGQQQRLMDDVAAIMAADLDDALKIVALERLDIIIGLPTGGQEA